ncbi:MAG: cytochrome c oxidase assembly factor Coa1 family protein [Nitrospiraceae bacterium]
MNVTCRMCQSTQSVPDEGLPNRLQQAVCPRCGANLVLIRAGATTAAASRAGGRPQRGDGPDSTGRRHKLLGIAAASIIFLVNLALIMGGGSGILHGVKTSEAYQLSVAFIRQNQEIQKVVGENLEFGFFPAFWIGTRGDQGNAEFGIGVRGSTGSADVHISLLREEGEWRVVKASYKDGTGKHTTLLDEAQLATTRKGWTKLHAAASRGRVGKVKVLLDQGDKVDAKDAEGRTPLHEASQHGHNKVVTLLIERGAQVGAKEKEFGQTPLHLAVEQQHAEIVKILLQAGGDVNARNKLRQTPLHQVTREAARSDGTVTQLLLDAGADFEARDARGFTPLVRAAAYGDLSCAMHLVARGANVNAKTEQGSTALIHAAKQGHIEVVQLLLEHGADVNAQVASWTALQSAESNGHRTVAELLRNYGGRSFGTAYEHAQRGHRFDERGKVKQAIAEYDKAIAINNDYAQVYYNRGVAYRKLKQYTRALADFATAIDLDPKYAAAYDNMGWIYARQGNYRESIRYWSKYLELKPNSGAGYLNRGGSYFRTGDRVRGLQDAQKACSLGLRRGCEITEQFKQGRSAA